MSRAALALLVILNMACRGAEKRAAGPEYAGAPVIVISIDTLRADHLPAYGYGGVETPAIDALRADGILYANAWSHCPMTLPSHVSLLTGLLPYEHGVRNNIGYTFDGARHDSLPAMLKRKGYATGAAVSAFVMRGDTGLGAAFDFYDDRTSGEENVAAGSLSRTGFETLAAAEPWLTENAGRPFFFLLHLFEPHAPYDAPEPYRSRAKLPYDAEIAAADAVVGRFIQQLKSSGAYDRSIVILLSDHGEGLGDHGEGEHGVFLYREALHVPLIVKLPGSSRRGTRVDAPAQLIDVPPTIVALTGARTASTMSGLSLTGDLPADRRIYSETLLPRIHFGWSELRSLADARHHYIDAPRAELYDYVADPGEKKNIAQDERRILSALDRDLEARAAAYAAPSAIDPEEAKKLAALGYIGQARNAGDDGPLPDPKDVIGQLEQLRQASAIEAGGDLRKAAALYRELAERNRRFADAWLRLATLQERFGERDAAIESYRRALTAAPALASNLAVRIGSLYLQAGRFEEATAHADLALATSPGSAHHLLGRIALARRDYPAAEAEARAAAADPAWRHPAAVLQAVVLLEQGRLAPALELLDRVRNDSAGTMVHDLELTRGDILARLNRAAEAEAAFQAEIAAFPQNREAYSRLALLFFATGQTAEAASTLERMYVASPGAGTARMAAGVAEAVGEEALAARWRSRGRP